MVKWFGYFWPTRPKPQRDTPDERANPRDLGYLSEWSLRFWLAEAQREATRREEKGL